jgi:hypothetical protein
MFTHILGLSSWIQPYHMFEITQQNSWSLSTWVIFGLVLLAPLETLRWNRAWSVRYAGASLCRMPPLNGNSSQNWAPENGIRFGHFLSGLLQNPPFSSIFCPMNTFIYSGFSGPSCPSGLRFWQRPTRLSQTLGSSYKGGWSGRILEIFWRCIGIIIITLR